MSSKLKLKNKTKNKLFLVIPVAFVLLILAFTITSTNTQQSKSDIQVSQFTKENYRIDYIFWSDCGACYNFTQALNEWKANKSFLQINYIPATGGNWTTDAKLFHTLEVLAEHDKGMIELIYNSYINNIHSRVNPVRGFDRKVEWLSSQFNISTESFLDTFNSVEVERMFIESQSINRQLNVRSTPQIIVNGETHLDLMQFNSYQEVFNAIETLFQNFES